MTIYLHPRHRLSIAEFLDFRDFLYSLVSLIRVVFRGLRDSGLSVDSRIGDVVAAVCRLRARRVVGAAIVLPARRRTTRGPALPDQQGRPS
jgi:hypothetical protein